MISVIVCSRMNELGARHQRNVAATIGTEYEYLQIDNARGQFGLCAAYNQGWRQARGELLVFAHEDVFFLQAGWGDTLREKFADASLGLVGLAGTQYLFSEPGRGWVAAGRPFIRGRVAHEINGQPVLTVFSHEKQDADVVAVDGLFFAIRRELFERVSFDEATFDRFHFYDLDICMQIRRTHRLIVTPDIAVKHLSGGSFNEEWSAYDAKFKEKYADELPVGCVSGTPDWANAIGFDSYRLKQPLPDFG